MIRLYRGVWPKVKIGLFGGGRWSRVWLDVLLPELRPDDEILWITRNHAAEARNYVSDRSLSRVAVFEDENRVWEIQPDLAILANHTTEHANLSYRTLSHQVATLCEKPFATNYVEAERLVQLAKKHEVPFGVNLQFPLAGYLQDFAKRLLETEVKQIDIIWRDPAHSIRYGEIKQASTSVPIVHDQLPHALSILEALYPQSQMGEIMSVTQDGEDTVVVASQGSAQAKMNLSRAGSNRERRIVINDGQIILDFAEEPLSEKPRPMTQAWREFRAVTEQRLLPSRWSQRAEKYLAHVRLCEAAAFLQNK